MTWSEPISRIAAAATILSIGALAAPTAWAGACCVGSTSATPTRLGECERALVGLGVSGEAADSRWDRDGVIQDNTIAERAGIATLAGGVRLNRELQLGATAPVRLNHRATGEVASWGGGVGDVGLSALWDPREEAGGPVPIFTAGLTAPTGRSWRASEDPLAADVTGVGRTTLSAGAAMERTLNRAPWSVGVTGALGLSAEGAYPSVQAWGMLGRYLGNRWTVAATARHLEAWAPGGEGLHNARTTGAGGRVAYGVPASWRAWVGVDSDLPLPEVGRSLNVTHTAGGGVAVIFR